MGLPLDVKPDNPSLLYEGVEYKDFWRGGDKHKLDELEHAIVRQLLPASGFRFIDIGCGFGRLADCYIDRFKQVIMVDGSMSLMQQAQKNTEGKAFYLLSDVMSLPFRNASFDAVLMVRVFHHISASQACMQELRRILCGGGRLIMTYHNKQNALRILKWILLLSRDNPFTLDPTGVGTTLLSHHPKAMVQFFNANRFTNIQYRGAGVVDKIAGKLGNFGKKLPNGIKLAPFFGKTKLAPWIFCSAEAVGDEKQPDTMDINELLICPICKGLPVQETKAYRCIQCNHRYPITNGIIDFRTR